MKRLCAITAAVTLTAWAAVAAPALKDDKTNLVVNGSFEDGPDIPEDVYKPLDKGSDAMKGWVVTRGQIDLIGKAHWASADGNRSLDLHGSPGLGGVMQKIKTKKGQKYRVTFALSVNSHNTTKAEKSLGVQAAGQQGSFKVEIAGKSVKEMKWDTKTWDFTATGDETELEFYTLETEEPFGGPALDNVSVTAVSK